MCVCVCVCVCVASVSREKTVSSITLCVDQSSGNFPILPLLSAEMPSALQLHYYRELSLTHTHTRTHSMRYLR